jgi:hypothetical protein
MKITVRTIVIVSLVCSAIPTLAQAKEPTGDFAVFSQCPRFTAGVELCLDAHITSGQVQIGSTTVPINKAITLQGGIIEAYSTETFVGALDGETLTRTPLTVPGGLSGIVPARSLPTSLQRIFAQTIASGDTSVTATTELVGPPILDLNDLENREGVGLLLPARVKLTNQFLGNECYIGSNASPLTLSMTTGTTTPPAPNRPISGRSGAITAKDEFNFIQINRDTLVDNSFSVPRANGCGGSLSYLLDPLIDTKIGLPSPAGTSTAIMNDTILEATSLGVIESEK